MKRFLTACTGVAAVAALLLTPVGDLLAKGKFVRLAVIEEFTSATCPPCVPAGPVLNKNAVLNKGIISVRVHMGYPLPGDDFNLEYPDGRKRHDFYNVGGIPAANLNGHYSIDPRNEQQILQAAANDQAYVYPVAITIKEDRSSLPTSNVEVEVETEMDLSDYVLHTVVIAKHVEWPGYSKELVGSNGEEEFNDAVLTMLPNVNGTPVSMTKGETKTFKSSFQIKDTRLWPKDGIYVVAYLQNNKTREIIQGATTEPGEVGSLVSTSIVRTSPDLPGFSIKDKGEKAEASFAISNNSKAAITYSVGKTTRTPENWAAAVEGGNATVTVPAGETKDVTVSFTKGEMTGIGDMVVTFKEADGTNRTYPIHTVLSKDVKTLQLMDDGGSTGQSLANVIAAAGRKDYYEVPGALVKPALADLPELKHMIWNCGSSGIITGDDQFLAMDLLEKGVGILFAGEAMTYSGNGTDPGASLHAYLGFAYGGKPIRLGGLNIRLAGIANDPVTGGFDQAGQLIAYYTPYIRPIDKKAVAIMTHKGFADSIVAIRSELDNARSVTFAFGPNVITNTTARKDLIDKALTWIEGFKAVAKPTLVSNIDLGRDLELGSVKIGESTEKTIELKAANEAGLQITEIIDWSENFAEYGLSIVGLPSSFPATPITLKKDETFSFKIRFAPTAEQSFDDARLSIKVNDEKNENPVITITGEGIKGTSSVGEVTSASGALFLTAGPNPFANTSVVTYAVKGVVAKDVRMTVYNELGQVVTTLLNTTVQPGTYAVDLNGVNMPVGTYHIIMTAGGEKVTLPVVHVK